MGEQRQPARIGCVDGAGGQRQPARIGCVDRRGRASVERREAPKPVRGACVAWANLGVRRGNRQPGTTDA
jgi:hypothetical protein